MALDCNGLLLALAHSPIANDAKLVSFAGTDEL